MLESSTDQSADLLPRIAVCEPNVEAYASASLAASGLPAVRCDWRKSAD
jgi:hypothetical protein